MIKFNKRQCFYLVIKRINAILFSILFLILLLPILLIIFIITLIDTKGHPIFIQERYGYQRRIFKIYKFRSIRDDHITRWGKFMRYTSLDELLQLINILKGDMSIVGPRPLWIEEKDIDELRKNDKYSPYNVKPGLTGYAQINYVKSSSLEEKATYDSYYVEHFSFWLDIKIVLVTIFKLVPINIHKN